LCDRWTGRLGRFGGTALAVSRVEGEGLRVGGRTSVDGSGRGLDQPVPSTLPGPRHQDVGLVIALLVDDVPIDVLAQRLGTSRGALYKTVHDARTRLRAELTTMGYLPAAPNASVSRRTRNTSGGQP